MELALVALCYSCAYLILFFICREGDSGRKACFAAFVLWLLYAAYEGIYIPQWMKTIHGAPIRVDLFLFIPVLTVISIVALIRFARRWRRDQAQDDAAVGRDKFRKRLVGGVAIALDGGAFLVTLTGASVSLFFGKLFASALFVLLAVGVLNRFIRRRRGQMNEIQRWPIWIPVLSAVCALIETAVVVESIHLPVRFDQDGFEKSNLLLVTALLLVIFYGNRYLPRRLLSREGTANAL